jgi:hypothetical protein
MDGAEAPNLPPPELLRKEDEEEDAVVEALAGNWLGAEAPEEESAGSWLKASAPGMPEALGGLVTEIAGQWLEDEVGDEAVPEVEPFTATYASASPGEARPSPVAEDPASVHEEAEKVAASSWTSFDAAPAEESEAAPAGLLAPAPPLRGPERGEYVPAAGERTVPQKAAVLDGAAGAAISDMLKRMDETLAMIRKLKEGRS